MRYCYFILFFVLVFGCNNPSVVSKKEHSLHWHKHAAEYKALCHQAFNLAKLRLDQALMTSPDQPLAIVADIDETLLNNLPYNEMLIETQDSFRFETWSEWVNQEIATAVPGAVDFINYADSNGVEVIYLSNRRVENYEPTKSNLLALGFPFDDTTQMLLKEETSDKTARRALLSNHQVVVFLGDNLADFATVFYKKDNVERSLDVDRLKDDFGDSFILFPNLIYGDWEIGFE